MTSTPNTPRGNLELLSPGLRLALLIGLAGLVAVPFAGSDFYTQMVTRMLVLSLFAMSFDLLQGVTGMVSQGHAAYFGLGGYALAFLTPASGPVSLWWSLPLVMAAMALLALAIGFVAIRTRGIYFIMVTLAISEMIFHLFFDNKPLGGSDGLYINFRPTLAFFGTPLLDLENKQSFYFLVLGITVLVFLFFRRLLWSPFGRALAGIRINEHRMAALGFDAFSYKLLAFSLGGAVAGLAGYLYGSLNGLVSPELIGFHTSALVLMMVVLGGAGNFAGAILGAFVYELVLFGFKDLPRLGPVDLGARWQLWLGLFIILLVTFAPRGILGAIHALSRQRGVAP